jgi:NDP-sugar pyrophosphorylase family protein
MLDAGERVYGFHADGYWRDIGTLRSYFDANMDALRGNVPRSGGSLVGEAEGTDYKAEMPAVEFIPPVIVGRGCRIERGCKVGPSVVLGDGCRAGAGCRLERVVALPRASFRDGESVTGCIRSDKISVDV